ncbi:MAG: hypothetical protein WBX27_01845 [Specibacter sp.]
MSTWPTRCSRLMPASFFAARLGGGAFDGPAGPALVGGGAEVIAAGGVVVAVATAVAGLGADGEVPADPGLVPDGLDAFTARATTTAITATTAPMSHQCRR